MHSRHLALFTLLTLAACLRAALSLADELAKAETPAAGSMLGNEAGDVRDDNGLKMKLVWCPPGSVEMEQVDIIVVTKGTPAVTGPVHAVREPFTSVQTFLTRGYWLGKYEVRQSEWKQVMENEPWKISDSANSRKDYPATYVSWSDAIRFCALLTEQERKAGRLPRDWEYSLPTEAQWERACRSRTDTAFSFGDDDAELPEYGWYWRNADGPCEVGQKKPNPWGLHDMHGNVYEWCRDYYSAKLPGGRDPEVTSIATKRVIRGGFWGEDAEGCRSASRASMYLDGGRRTGFRVALTRVKAVK